MNPMKAVLALDRLPHGWNVLSAILLGGSITALAWWAAESGWLDLAATALAFYVMTLVRLIGGSLTRIAPKEMKRTAGLLDTAREDMAEFLRNRRVIALSLIAALMTVGFMVGRQLATVLLTAIASPFVAVAAGCAIAAAVTSPVLVRATMQTIGGRRGAADRDEAADE